MTRISLVFLALLVTVGCNNSTPTAPSSTQDPQRGPLMAISDVKINSFELGAVSIRGDGLAMFTISYDVVANMCVLMVFQSTTADTTKIVGGGEVPVLRNTTQQVLMPRYPGEHLTELRCVNEPGATVGVIEKRTLVIP